MSRRARWALIAAIAIGGCSIDPDANPGRACGEDESCPAGLTCYRGFCVATGGMDAGPTEDAGPIDAGSETCEPETRRPCYTGPMGTEDVLPCRAGEQVCGGDGRWGDCVGEVIPADEVECNGVDDDCDATADEFATPDCDTTGLPGVCSTGTKECRGMEVACVPTAMPAAETCDSRDEDCDMMVDEGTDAPCYPGMTMGCTRRADGTYDCTGICAAGMQRCSMGTLGTCTGMTVPAMGDGCTMSGTAVDNDCDGNVDEDCVCTPGAMQACYTGPAGTAGTGICRTGNQTCTMMAGMGRWGACSGEVTPGTESCANEGADDDCNGTDDDLPGRGDACSVAGTSGICAMGTRQCMGGTLTCIGPMMRTEICNGLDDDCDSTVDDGFNLLTDEANCGMCGRACGAGLTCCGGVCVDDRADETNCGACGMRCGEGVECCSGSCIDLRIDEMNCGACGAPCGGGRTCCGGMCSDTTQDEVNCGTCGTACTGTDECCGSACRTMGAPECVTCADDCAASGLDCCVPSCVDRDTDPANCGTCGNACAPGQLCCGGSCVANDVNNCGGCGVRCTGGTPLCCSGSCVRDDAAHCRTCDVRCDSGEDCCPDGCHNLSSDPMNCDECGLRCAPGQICSNRLCCMAGQTNCGGMCTNTDTDVRNCGGCGHECMGLGSCGCSAGECTGLLCS